MSEPNIVHLAKAETLDGSEHESVTIVVDGDLPPYASTATSKEFFDGQADLILRAFRHLPGGTLDSLLAKMLDRRAQYTRRGLWV